MSSSKSPTLDFDAAGLGRAVGWFARMGVKDVSIASVRTIADGTGLSERDLVDGLRSVGIRVRGPLSQLIVPSVA